MYDFPLITFSMPLRMTLVLEADLTIGDRADSLRLALRRQGLSQVDCVG